MKVLYGSRHGVTTTGAQHLDQNTSSVLDSAEADDNFGWAVTAGRFRGTKVADLAVGIPFEDVVSPNDNAGG